MTRNTRQKAAIRQALSEAGRPLSIEEILNVAQRQVDGLGLATVYRNLKSLLDEGWLVAVDLPGQTPRYELSGKGHHHHFQCRICGHVFELHNCSESFRHMVPDGFEVTSHEVLLFGRCASCRSAHRA